MPVNVLLCEGSQNSPDVRVLLKLLAGRCEIRPMGGKYGMGERIKARREVLGGRVVFGVLDGDFQTEWRQPTSTPRQWIASDGDMLGWRWERKELENYLIDPAVVKRSMRTSAPDEALYLQALEKARDQIGIYQAARTALSANRPKFKDLPNSFGRERGREKHPFPDALDQDACLRGMRDVVGQHLEQQSISHERVRETFEHILPEFCNQGSRYIHYLAAFSGKDLLWAMDDRLREMGFGGVLAFREKVLGGIAQTTEDIAEWCPEWRRLREIIDQI